MSFAAPTQVTTERFFSDAETDSLVKAITDVLARTPKTQYQHMIAYRDLTIIDTALLTGLREHEIVALNVGDLLPEGSGQITDVVPLSVFKGCTNPKVAKHAASRQRIALPDVLRARLADLFALKRAFGHEMERNSPVFVSRHGTRLSTRMVRSMFADWCAAAKLPKGRGFHCLRHTACTRFLRANDRDVAAVRDFARHADARTTCRYLHTTDAERRDAAERLAARASGPQAAETTMDFAQAQRLLLELAKVLATVMPANGTNGTGL